MWVRLMQNAMGLSVIQLQVYKYNTYIRRFTIINCYLTYNNISYYAK